MHIWLQSVLGIPVVYVLVLLTPLRLIYQLPDLVYTILDQTNLPVGQLSLNGQSH